MIGLASKSAGMLLTLWAMRTAHYTNLTRSLSAIPSAASTVACMPGSLDRRLLRLEVGRIVIAHQRILKFTVNAHTGHIPALLICVSICSISALIARTDAERFGEVEYASKALLARFSASAANG